MKRLLVHSVTFMMFLFASGEAFQPLFDQYSHPSPQLFVLLHILGMKGQATGEVIDQWAQEHLTRRGERWEEQWGRFEGLRELLWPLLQELGFIEEESPHLKIYEGAIVSGGLALRVRIRLQYLIDQWNHGTRFNHLYFLCGDRPLEPTLEHFPGAQTEGEMMRIIWKEMDVPQLMRAHVPVHFIDSSRRDGYTRSTTRENVEAWLRSEPPPGNYLAVSNAPHTLNQHLVLQSLTPPEINIETIGPQVAHDIRMAIIIDEVARSIHTELNP